MKKRFLMLIALILALSLLLTGCRVLPDDEAADEPIYVMTSFYPVYALAVNVVKDVPALTLGCLIQPQDGCPRSYSLSNWDAAVIAQQDAFIIAGSGFESFETALGSVTDGPALLTLLSGRTLRDNGEAVTEESSHLDGPNPWLFMSVSGAIEMTISLGNGLAQLDERYAQLYLDNMDDTIDQLEALASTMKGIVSSAPQKSVACLHEGLGYLAESCNLTVCAELAREPGSEQIGNDLEALLEDLAASGAEVVLLEMQAPRSLITALEEAGYSIALIDTLLTHQADGNTGAYERIMLQNARALADALNNTPKTSAN